ncbi:hypothetical protein [Aquitalea magnusonii]|uniref:Uncharacterized protein n=2 Tax=Aquitalea magnusonii TaxID=332411 RepID=A0A318J523_9NEIS|nr:hypothetical protein [Aquitalea magnusonii]PXX42221.1 hypothetical protein DFR38_12018 [Aquitalea magnusonii]
MATKTPPKAQAEPGADLLQGAGETDGTPTTEANTDQEAISPAELPALIALTCPFGFYDESKNLRMWQAGQVVTDADEIKLLVDFGAEHVIPE